MVWLIQNALFGDEFGYDSFIAAIDATGERRIPVDWALWESTIDLKLTGVRPGEVMPFGTRSFVCYAKASGWIVYWDEAYQYSSLLCLGDEFINYDLQVAPLDELKVPEDGKIFIRENDGFNIIKGKVISAYAWPEWVERFKWGSSAEGDGDVKKTHHDWHPIDGSTLFVCAPVKKIIDEYRVWIVGGKVVSASQYVKNGDIQYTNSDENWEICCYAQKMVGRMPFDMNNYVLDVFRTDKGLKVGELNCLHCSGWYAIDSRKVVAALNGLVVDSFSSRCSNLA